MFMKKLAVAGDRANEAMSYFFRLETQLSIKDQKSINSTEGLFLIGVI